MALINEWNFCCEKKSDDLENISSNRYTKLTHYNPIDSKGPV